MVNITINNEMAIFEIKNHGINDLKEFYTIEYFEFLGFNPEIYIRATRSWEDEMNDRIVIPFRHFTNFVKDTNISIKQIKMPQFRNQTLFKNEPVSEVTKIQNRIPVENENNDSKLKLLVSKKKIPRHQDEIITLKIKVEKDGKLQTFQQVLDENKRLYENDIEMNEDGVFYQDIESILKIQHYIETEVFYNEIYRLNGKYIIIKDNEMQGKSFHTIDTSRMRNTLITKLYTK